MARAVSRSAARSRATPASAKCACNPGWLLVAAVLLAFGLYGIAGGFVAQFSGASASNALVWYFIGILLVMFGKITKWKSHGCCTVHDMK